MSASTILVLSGMGLPPYSARGLNQKLEHLGQASQTRRTVNGALRDLSDTVFRKYASSISSGGDVDPPALEGIWPGMQLTVDCIVELAVANSSTTDATTEPDLGRTPVPGSVRNANGFTFYRPRLTMMVTAFDVDRDEWGAVHDWSMSLEEV